MLLLFFPLLFLILPCHSFKEEGGVLVLTSENFDQAISSHENILVEFYAPWCGHCKALAPEYSKAALKLKEEGSLIKLAKVDATIETELGKQHEVQGFPTIKFFRNQVPIEYNGGRDAAAIIQWLQKKTGPPLVILENPEAASAFVDQHNVAIVAFFNDAKAESLKNIEEVARHFDEHPFALATTSDIHEKLSAKDGTLVLFKKFDDRRVDYTGDFSVSSLKEFVSSNELPLVVEFNPDVSAKVFGSDVKTHLVTFLAASAPEHESRISTLTEVAKKFRGQLHVVYVNTEVPDHLRILEFFGLSKDNVPAYRLVNLKDDMVKFKPDSENFALDDILAFVSNGLEGKLKPLLLSQDIPSDWDAKPVKVLVGRNFDLVARDKSKAVFVEFYAPWCGHCKKLAPIWDELGETYINAPDVVIAKVDATANEIEGIKIASFPTLKYFPKDSDDIIDYDGDRTLSGFKAFLESNGKSVSGDKHHDEL